MLSYFIVAKVFFRKVSDGDVGGFHETSIFGWTIEISMTVDRSVVFTNGLVVFYADPNTCKVDLKLHKTGYELSMNELMSERTNE